MKTKLIYGLLFLSCSAIAGETTVPLLAGQHTQIGTVTATDNGNEVCVQYNVTDLNFTLDLIHVEVATSLNLIPQTKNNNPKVGKFTYQSEDTATPYCISFAELGISPGDTVAIAAHADTGDDESPVNLDAIEAILPETVTFEAVYPGDGFGVPSYFDTTILDTSLSGIYDGWCVDLEGVPPTNKVVTAEVFSSYGDVSTDVVEIPENLDIVNWVINQDFTLKTSPGCGGTYTFKEVQYALWELADTGPNTAPDLCRVNEILDMAYEFGDGFVPSCDQSIAIILRPFDYYGNTNGQITVTKSSIIDLGISCGGGETAWGGDMDFGGSSWALYFEHTTMD